jgi:hypothetical protein
MKQRPYSLLALLLSTVLVLLPVTAARGYVLQGPHLLDMMLGQMGRAQQLLVTQKLITYGEFMEEGSDQIDETVRYRQPDRFRADVIAEELQRIYVSVGGEALLIMGGQTVSETESLYERYKELFLYPDRPDLVTRLMELDINVWLSSMGHIDGKPAYVVGALYPDRHRSQLWIAKDTFRPARLISVVNADPETPEALEVRFRNWQQFGKMWYPLLMEFYRNKQLVREIRVEHIEVNPVFQEDYFNLMQLRETYPPSPALQPEPPAPLDVDEVEETINQFKKIYE